MRCGLTTYHGFMAHLRDNSRTRLGEFSGVFLAGEFTCAPQCVLYDEEKQVELLYIEEKYQV